MKVSHLVTCCNETNTLSRLLYHILNTMNSEDEVIILQDNCSDGVDEYGKTTSDIIKGFINCPGFPIGVHWFKHSLDNDYGAHKNFGIEKCTGDFIFQIDGDEMPPDALLSDNLHDLLESNPTVEAYAVPRMNDFKGVTEAHAKQWGWVLTYNARPSLNDKTLNPLVNWPDYQWRLFKNDPKIRFKNRLHERIDGFSSYVVLPAEQDYALYHDKTIEKQIETNLRYNKDFLYAENLGRQIPLLFWNINKDGDLPEKNTVLNDHPIWNKIYESTFKPFLIKQSDKLEIVEIVKMDETSKDIRNKILQNHNVVLDNFTHFIRLKPK